MKLLAAYIILMLLFLGSCCSGYDGYGYTFPPKKENIITFLDTSARILSITYLNNNQKFTFNSRSARLLIATNNITNAIIETNFGIDTISILNETKINLESSNYCEGDSYQMEELKPVVLLSTFDSVAVNIYSKNKIGWEILVK